jgi:Rrf2 family protein
MGCHLQTTPGAVLSVEDISTAQKLPHALLRRILQRLARADIIQSIKGKGGGFGMRKALNDITVAELVMLFQPYVIDDVCYVRQKRCTSIKTCKVRKRIGEINKMVNEQLELMTIASLL